MKVVSDKIANGAQIFSELLEFEQVARELCRLTDTYANAGNGRPLPRFVTETTMGLKKSLIKEFGTYFPALHEMIENGKSSDSGMARINDALYAFGGAQREIFAANCVLFADDKRAEIFSQLARAVGDIVVFICIQFNLYNLESGEISMAVQTHCDRCGITPDVLYGLLLQDMRDVGQTWYAFEVMSPLYQDLLDFDPIFAAECEEHMYPLTDAIAQTLISGEQDVAVVRGYLLKYSESTIEKEVNITPAGLISRMKLE